MTSQFYLGDAKFNSAGACALAVLNQSRDVRADAVSCCLEWWGITETEEGANRALDYLVDLFIDHPRTLAAMVRDTLQSMEGFYLSRADPDGDGHTDGSGTSPIGVTV